MKTRNGLIVLVAMGMFSVSAQANDCCEFNPVTFPTAGCVSGPAAQFSRTACESSGLGGNLYVPNAWCDTTTFRCMPKPGGGDNRICSFLGVPPGDPLADDTCRAILGNPPGAPAVSEWGLSGLALLLLSGVALKFARSTAPKAVTS